MERLKSSPSSTRPLRDKHVSAGNWTWVACVTEENSSKELFAQLTNNYSEHNVFSRSNWVSPPPPPRSRGWAFWYSMYTIIPVWFETSRHGYTQRMCQMNNTWKHMNCTRIYCRPNSTCKSFGPKYQALASMHVWCKERQITPGSSLWRDLIMVISIFYNSIRDWHVPARNGIRASVVGGEHSSKELFKQLFFIAFHNVDK